MKVHSIKMRPLSRDDVRTIDRRAIEEYGLPGLVLMENAGRGAAAWLDQLAEDGSSILVCCGKGNNGGDGYVMARHLDIWGYDVAVLLACQPDEIQGDALTNYRVIQHARIPTLPAGSPQSSALFQRASWIVDGLLGTGIQGEVREPYTSLIDTVNRSPARTFAIDVPSGLNCDTGQPCGIAVRAAYTATFVSLKLGFQIEPAREYVGDVRVIDIGVPAHLLKQYCD